MGDFFRQKMALLLGAIAATVVASVAAAACIPDLDTSTPPLPPSKAAYYCGDGFIDFDAGEQCDPGEAGAPGCTAKCAMDCEGGLVDPRTNHCYFAIPGSLRFTDAFPRCAFGNGHVVTFSSDSEFRRVVAWAGDASFWVGIWSTPPGFVPPTAPDEPGWTTRCPGCYARATASGAFPRIQDAGGNCLAATSAEGPWTTAPCATPMRVICEREPVGAATQLCNGALCMELKQTFGAKRYVYVSEAKTGDDARHFCEQFNKGSLVVLASREEREQLWAALEATPAPPQQIWLGLSRGDDGGVWQWDDSVADADGGAYPSPWGDRQPVAAPAGLSRAFLSHSQSLADSQLARNDPPPIGGDSLPFVCQYRDTD